MQNFHEISRQYDFQGGTIDAILMRTVGDSKSNVPIVLAPGWGVNLEALRDGAQRLVKCGRNVIAYEHPRVGGNIEADSRYPTPQLRKALALQTLLKAESIPQVDAIAHSESIMTVAILGNLQPNTIRNIVAFSPAGLLGQDRLPNLLLRFARSGLQEITRNAFTSRDAFDRTNAMRQSEISYVMQNPLRAFEEARSATHYRIENLLKRIHDQGSKIVIIQSVDDLGIPMKRLRQNLQSGSNPTYIDGFLSVKGTHDQHYITPEHYMAVAEQMLTLLEKE